MKKIKLLLLTPALITPATLAFTSCSNGSVQEGVYLDESVTDKVKMAVTHDTEGNFICNLQLNSELIELNKISSISVKVNGNVLTVDQDYSVEMGSLSSGTAQVSIFAKTLKEKRGKYIVSPVVEARKFDGIITDVERKTYLKGDVVTKDNITLYQSLEGTQGEKIEWSNEVQVYEGETLIENFITSGYTIGIEYGAVTLTIKYKGFSANAEITVSKKQYKITCTMDADQCAELTTDCFYATEGDTWGSVLSKPVPRVKTDVNLSSLTWKWVDPTTLEEISDTTVISADMSAKLVLELPTATETAETIDFDTQTTKFTGITSYVPAVCVDDEGNLKSTNLITNKEYTFSITVPTDISIKYFWFYNCSTYKAADLIYLYKNSILSIKDGSGVDIPYTIGSWTSGGNYISFDTALTAGTKANIKFRMLKEFDCIPAFEVVA